MGRVPPLAAIPLPPHRPGMRIGLYGGSFDPPHRGHMKVALLALNRLGLDRVWWIVGPGNPLKDRGSLPGVAERLAAVRRIAAHPRMIATDFEARLGARFTIDTVRYLRRRCPGIRFVWILGADSFATLHRWRAWREILRLMPVAVVDRPGWTLRAAASPASRTSPAARCDEGAASRFAGRTPPAWIALHGPRSSLSSTAIRAGSRPAGAPH